MRGHLKAFARCSTYSCAIFKNASEGPSVESFVIDESSPALSNQLRGLLARFQATGTRWEKLSQVIETPFFFDSKTSRLMQIADFSAYAVFRWYESGDDSYLPKIHSKFDRELHRVHGLKCYPLICTKHSPPLPPPQAKVGL